jgi:hypothetical protein
MIKPLLLLAVVAGPALAQNARIATIGDRVRVVAPQSGHRTLVGVVTATTPDFLSLNVDGSVGEFSVRRDQIRAIDLSETTRRHAVRGAVVGGLAGLVVAHLFGPKKDAIQGIPNEVGSTTTTKNLITGTVTGAAFGALAGRFVKTDVWLPISPAAR